MKICIALILTFSSLAHCELLWESVEGALPPSAEEREAKATFRFQNVGKERIRVIGLKTSCACATAIVGKKEYAPGESGELHMTIDRKGRLTDQVESTVMTTSDGARTV